MVRRRALFLSDLILNIITPHTRFESSWGSVQAPQGASRTTTHLGIFATDGMGPTENTGSKCLSIHWKTLRNYTVAQNRRGPPPVTPLTYGRPLPARVCDGVTVACGHVPGLCVRSRVKRPHSAPLARSRCPGERPFTEPTTPVRRRQWNRRHDRHLLRLGPTPWRAAPEGELSTPWLTAKGCRCGSLSTLRDRAESIEWF